MTESSSEIYFDGKLCASDPAFNPESMTLQYQAVFGTYKSGSDILLSKKMKDVPVVCNYKQIVNEVVAFGAEILIDEVDQKEKLSNDNRAEISITAETFVEKQDKSYASVSDDVLLGQNVKIVFTSSNNILPGRI